MRKTATLLAAITVCLAAALAPALGADAVRERLGRLDAASRRVGFFADVGRNLVAKAKTNVHANLFGDQMPIPKPMVPGVPDPEGAANRVPKGDERCVICQYLVQRVNAELLLNGVNGGVPYAAPGGEFESAARSAAAGNLQGGSQPGTHGDPFQQSYTPPPSQQAGVTDEQHAAEEQTGEAAADLELLELDARQRRVGFASALLGGIATGKALSGGVEGMQEADLFNQGLKKPDFLPGGKAWRTPRERHIGLMAFRPTQRRYTDMRDGPLRAAKRAEQRYEENQMFSVAYQTMEDLCTKRMPAPYYGYCGLLMKNYEKISQGLRWKDRPDSICMGMGFCAAESYVQKGPHAVYRPF